MSELLKAFSVPLDPIPFARPRFHGKQAFTAPRYARFKKQFRQCSEIYRPFDPWQRPLRIVLEFYLKAPKVLRADRPYPTKVPDLDNLVKAILDSLNPTKRKDKSTGQMKTDYPGFWKDDCWIVDCVSQKRWALNRSPGISVSVYGL